MKFGQVIAFKDTKNLYESLFQFFEFLAIFWGFCSKKWEKFEFFDKNPLNWAKNRKNQKSEYNILFVLFLSTTWPNFMFLALFGL